MKFAAVATLARINKKGPAHQPGFLFLTLCSLGAKVLRTAGWALGNPPSHRKTAMTQAKPTLSITYCTQCNWLLRSAWMASEILSTFSLEMGAVTLIPGTGGIFEIRIDGALVWERKRDGGFPDVKQLKQLVRDRIDPERDLGHIDRHGSSSPA